MLYCWLPVALLGVLPFLLILRWSNVGHCP